MSANFHVDSLKVLLFLGFSVLNKTDDVMDLSKLQLLLCKSNYFALYLIVSFWFFKNVILDNFGMCRVTCIVFFFNISRAHIILQELVCFNSKYSETSLLRYIQLYEAFLIPSKAKILRFLRLNDYFYKNHMCILLNYWNSL